MAEECRRDGIAFNSLWPLTAIDTAVVRSLLGGQTVVSMSRLSRIMADAAHAILTGPSRETTGICSPAKAAVSGLMRRSKKAGQRFR